jgi:hypothetical protein
MVNTINEILSKSVEEVIKSPLSLSLLKCYSTLYLGGNIPRGCAVSQRNYYNQLSIDGLKKAEQMEEVLNATCIFKADIMPFISALQIHITRANCTDALAIEGLKKGWLKECQFDKLPDAYTKAKEEGTEPIAPAQFVAEKELDLTTTPKKKLKR